MLIGIDASRANKKHKTGVEWYSYHLIRRLARLDSKNEYVLYTDQPLTGGLVDLCKKDNPEKGNVEIRKDKNGFQILKSPHGNFKAKVLKWPIPFFWTLGRFSLEMFLKKPDILFVPAHGIPFFSPPKTINTIHDIAFVHKKKIYDKSDILKKGFLRKCVNSIVKFVTFGKYSANSRDYLRWSVKFSLRNSKKIIAISEATKNEILEYYGNDHEDKIEVIHNGYDANDYKKIGDSKRVEEVLEKYGIVKPYFLYAGRLERKKNTPLLVDAFAMAKETNKKLKHKLVLIGPPGFGYDEVKYTIQEFNLDNEVIIPGWVDQEDMSIIFSEASVFIFPSLYEGFGIPVLEAMSSEVPVIASHIPALKEVANDAALFFNKTDKLDLAQAMNKMLDEDLRNKYISLGKERINKFSLEKCASETLKLIENL